MRKILGEQSTNSADQLHCLQGGHMAVSLSGDFKANLAQLPDVDGIESITLTFKDTGERCGGVRPASWRSCMCSRRRVQERIPESAHRAIFAQM